MKISKVIAYHSFIKEAMEVDYKDFLTALVIFENGVDLLEAEALVNKFMEDDNTSSFLAEIFEEVK